MTDRPTLPLDRPLDVVEDRAAWYVVVDDDHEDWLVRYDKDGDFPADVWARNMATTYNERWFSSRRKAAT